VLKLQVKQAVELSYLSGICNCTTRLSNVSLLAMLNHLFTTYCTISSMQLDANNTEMLKEWDPNMPVELLFTQIEEGQEFADEGGQSYTNQQVLKMALNIIFHTSLFKCTCCKWCECLQAKKTWTNFKTHFATTQTKLEAECDTEKGGYLGAYAMLQQHNLHQTETLANLANATVANRQCFEILTNTNSELNKTIKTLQVQKTALEAKRASLNKEKHCDCHPPSKNVDLNGYCSTHCYLVSKNCTSVTCKNKYADHKDNTTHENPMGGSTHGKPE
jgi:hypothetical protein